MAVVNDTEPDVVLTDLTMPGMDGAATRLIIARHPNIAVLVVTMHDDNQALIGASGPVAREVDDRGDMVGRLLDGSGDDVWPMR